MQARRQYTFRSHMACALFFLGLIAGNHTGQAQNVPDNNPITSADTTFTFAVMADPQAFRLASGGDPNSESVNGAEWRRLNNSLVRVLNDIRGIDFGIINGDITEFGREDSWENVLSIYNTLYFPYYYGLGNHDYQNNVGDCANSSFWPSNNGCAIYSLNQMSSALNRYGRALEYFSQDWNLDNNYLPYKGSMSYSWDHKGVRCATIPFRLVRLT